MARFEPKSTAPVREKAILVGVDFGRNAEWTLDESMAELARLAETDGADVVFTLTQRLEAPADLHRQGQGGGTCLLRAQPRC